MPMRPFISTKTVVDQSFQVAVCFVAHSFDELRRCRGQVCSRSRPFDSEMTFQTPARRALSWRARPPF